MFFFNLNIWRSMLEPKNCRTDLVEHLKQISLGHLAKSTYSV